MLASGLAVTAAILLAARTRLHRFVRKVLSRAEMVDALILAAAALVVLPMLPDTYLGPFQALNLRTVWKFTVLVMAVSAAGHIALRHSLRHAATQCLRYALGHHRHLGRST